MKAEAGTSQLSLQIAESVMASYIPVAPVLDKIAQKISGTEKFLLTTHVSADADGIGSQLGLRELLLHLGKDVVVLNNEAVPEYLRFMVPENSVLNIEDFENKADDLRQLLTGRFVFILDSSELKRSAAVAEAFTSAGCEYSSIDHHILPEDPRFFVDPSYGATAEMIWDLYQFMKIPVNAIAAQALYAGLVADTGNFRYPKTSLRTHIAAGHLISFGIHSDYIYRILYESHPVDRLKYLRKILKRVIINKKAGFVAGTVVPSMLKGLELGDSASEGIVNMLLATKGTNVAALMTRTDDGKMKCSLRSVGDYDVAAIAKVFGGGGHKNAGGLKADMPFRKARKRLLKILKEGAPKS